MFVLKSPCIRDDILFQTNSCKMVLCNNYLGNIKYTLQYFLKWGNDIQVKTILRKLRKGLHSASCPTEHSSAVGLLSLSEILRFHIINTSQTVAHLFQQLSQLYLRYFLASILPCHTLIFYCISMAPQTLIIFKIQTKNIHLFQSLKGPCAYRAYLRKLMLSQH